MASMQQKTLPADLFHMLAIELSDRLDFDTLFNYMVSSRHVANAGAVAALYRKCHLAPIKGGNENLSIADQGLVLQRWSILWRTIILSAFGSTLYPYCQYLRVLDLRDLWNLLDDANFHGRIRTFFFSGALSNLEFMLDAPVRTRRAARLDLNRAVSIIGERLTSEARLVEALSEPTDSSLLSTSLPLWIPKLANLKSLDLYDGQALADLSIQDSLHANCPHLSSLTIYNAVNEDADHMIARFIGGMQENGLAHFQNISICRIGAESCLALNRHSQSLQSLRLSLDHDGILALALLRSCTALVELSVACETVSTDLKATQNDTYLEIIEWLNNCNALQEVSLDNIVSAPDLLIPVLLNQKVKLQKLQVSATDERAMYVVKDHHDFHNAIAAQRHSLQNLLLCADPDWNTRDDNQNLALVLYRLRDLRELRLTRIADYFDDEILSTLFDGMACLEDLYIGGNYSDSVLGDLAGLGRLVALKNICFSGNTTFTASGLLDLVSGLEGYCEGMNLSIDNADPDYALSPDIQEAVRQRWANEIGGKFEYQSAYVPDISSDVSD